MDEGIRGISWRMSYIRARRLVLIAGLVVLILTAVVMFARRVETVEVLGTLLFIPVLIAFVAADMVGGVIAGLLAAVGYAVLRYPAIDAVGFDRFAGLIGSRALAYVAFGIIGGWANRQLAASLTKLELYDQIDDTTGLYNARFFVQDTDLEMSRSQRYQTLFSVAVVDLPVKALEALGRRRRSVVLKGLGRMLQTAVRTVDRPVHTSDGKSHWFGVVLPETGPEGARVFTERLADRVAEYVNSRGGQIAADEVKRHHATFPEDDERLEELRNRFAAVDRLEHPEQ
jgi:GGDEF domain-containing protein